MATDSLFPKSMLESTTLSLETVAAKLTYFQIQLHLIHWQTSSYAEHQAVGNLYDYISGFKDEVVEKLMGYTNRKVKAFKLEVITDNANCVSVVSEIITFAHSLMEWAEANKYCDIENLAQSLSGEASKTRYLLTLK